MALGFGKPGQGFTHAQWQVEKLGINAKIAFSRFSFAKKTFEEWTSFAPIGSRHQAKLGAPIFIAIIAKMTGFRGSKKNAQGHLGLASTE